MVTMSAGRPPSPIQLQFSDRPEYGPNGALPNYQQQLFGNDQIPSTQAFALNSTLYGMTAQSSLNAQSLANESTNNRTRTDFWRQVDGNYRVRPVKRSSALREESNNDDSPQRKLRITEEKMLARLRNFHITSAPSNVHSNWFFMQKPVEHFDDMENRMSDDEEEEEKDSAKNGIDDEFDNDVMSESNALLLSDVLKRILKEDHKRAVLPLNPCTDLVLWKPPGDFIKEIIPDLTSKDVQVMSTDFTGNHHDITHDGGASTAQFNEEPSTLINGLDAMDGGIESVLQQRRNARQFSRPIIEVFNVSSNNRRNDKNENYPEYGHTFDDSGAMDID